MTRDDGNDRVAYSIAEAATRLGIGRTAMYEAVRSGQFPSVRIGGRVLVPRYALDRLGRVHDQDSGRGNGREELDRLRAGAKDAREAYLEALRQAEIAPRVYLAACDREERARPRYDSTCDEIVGFASGSGKYLVTGRSTV